MFLDVSFLQSLTTISEKGTGFATPFPLLLRDFLLVKELRDYIQDLRNPTEKAMAPHSSTLAWKIPWMEEPGRLQSMGSLRVGHD